MTGLKLIFGGIVACLLAICTACTPQVVPTSIPTETITVVVPPTLTATTTPPPPATVSPTPTYAPRFITRADTQEKSANSLVLESAGITYGDFEPAVSDDGIIQNVYETLLFHDETSSNKLIPLLAEEWTISEDGKTYVFHIRKNVKFHDGSYLSPSDVAFSIHRALLQGESPQGLLSEPFFGIGIFDVAYLIDSNGALVGNDEQLRRAPSGTLKSICENVKSIILANETSGTVTMTLTQPWPQFLATLAQPSASIMKASWVEDHGGWNGSCDTWHKHYYDWSYPLHPFKSIANGTGPFKLAFWSEQEATLTRNDEYWQTPANFERINIRYRDNGNTVLSMMESNTADAASADLRYWGQMEEFVGERCNYDPINKTYLPCEIIDEEKPYVEFSGSFSSHQYVLLFDYDIAGSYGNIYIGSARLDGKGIPPDFFTDTHIRKAFTYCLDWNALIQDRFYGQAVQSTQLLPPPIIGYNPDMPSYQFDMEKCKNEFLQADADHDGIPADQDDNDVWKTGFYFKYLDIDNSVTQAASRILAKNLKSINAGFIIEPHRSVQNLYTPPMRVTLWTSIINDPYHWFEAYTTGYYNRIQSFPIDLKVQFQEIFTRALAESDPLKRANIYNEASLLYYDQAVGIPLVILKENFYWRRAVQGMTLNPFSPNSYFYPLSKK